MANQYLLNFLLREQPSPVEFEVRESHWLRAKDLFGREESFYNPARFLTFDTVDGLAVAVGFADVQRVHFLYNPVEFASDQKHKDDDVHVWLRGRDTPVSVLIDDDTESLAAFFVALDTGADFEQFPGFTDIDGELVLFNLSDVVFVTAPLHKVNEGHRELMADGEPSNEDDW